MGGPWSKRTLKISESVEKFDDDYRGWFQNPTYRRLKR